MSSSTPAQPLVHPVGSARVWGTALAVVGVLLLLTYLVAFDQGAVSRSGMYLHELMHDGRHLLGVPCH
ncbi:CbtB-domain containing protein [Micromonospora matsumotoense]|uniref:Probable cobalt transporter subunit (CbtB) n=1 Tax=Micromonospora matsumotoense TaxID=121616 RepID=A0A1C4V9N8_9ACTN|nr:CbtB-domain containing protein [Micromonospora matsumotoense]SCE80475.1 Probable cobalt transporter subunit (CbtB) [Micromonospora matsumotoense]